MVKGEMMIMRRNEQKEKTFSFSNEEGLCFLRLKGEKNG